MGCRDGGDGYPPSFDVPEKPPVVPQVQSPQLGNKSIFKFIASFWRENVVNSSSTLYLIFPSVAVPFSAVAIPSRDGCHGKHIIVRKSEKSRNSDPQHSESIVQNGYQYNIPRRQCNKI